MNQQFRTRKGGQHYPLNPKVIRPKQVYSPSQLLLLYEKTQSPAEKLRLKRAAQSKANFTKDPEWINIVNKIKSPPPPPQQQQQNQNSWHPANSGNFKMYFSTVEEANSIKMQLEGSQYRKNQEFRVAPSKDYPDKFEVEYRYK